MRIEKHFRSLLILMSLALASCETMKVPNTRIYAVAGVLSAGADWAETLSDNTGEITLDEFIDFLEPQPERPDPNDPTKVLPEKGGAICQSSDDYNKNKTALEIACRKLGSFCSYEMKQAIAGVAGNIDNLQFTTMAKAKGITMEQISTIPRLGDVGKDVVKLQKALAAKGFDPGLADGRFGGNTKKAIVALQKANKLKGGGVIGPVTLQLLNLTVVAVQPITERSVITRDLPGRQARFLHPTLRVAIEARVFPNGAIPKCFHDGNIEECVIRVARAIESLKVREEGGNNKGATVGIIQSVIGSYSKNGDGAAWCMSTDQCIIAFLEDYFQIESPIIASELCTAVWKAAKKVPGLTSLKCVAGSFWIAQNGSGPSGHTGTTLAVLQKKQTNFEGNTGDGSIFDGDGAYFRDRDQFKNGKLSTLGWVFLYPDNKLPAAA